MAVKADKRIAQQQQEDYIMLIKLQRTRFSDTYFIIEGAREVSYIDNPLSFDSESKLLAHTREFMNSVTLERRSTWFQTDTLESLHLPGIAGTDISFPGGYKLNQVSFTNRDGERESILFDGETFICNDEGRTIHRIRAGGCQTLPPLQATNVPSAA